MASALESGQPVTYSGQLKYGNGRQNGPTGIRMTASTANGVLFDEPVSNTPGSQVTC